MIALYKDPNGDKIFTQTPAHNNNTVGKSQPVPSVIDDKSVVVHALEVRIKGLESRIEELTVRLFNTIVGVSSSPVSNS